MTALVRQTVALINSRPGAPPTEAREIGLAEVGSGQVRIAQKATIEAGSGQVGSGKIRALSRSAAQVGGTQVGAWGGEIVEPRVGHSSAGEHGTFERRADQFGVDEPGFRDPRASELHPLRQSQVDQDD